jgi:phosphopantothenoylcysteine decarboxylase/phosphopantothenate--cysteine ligase
MKILITSGGCRMPIDDVRHMSNFSSGRYGAEIFKQFFLSGHEVIFFHERGSRTPELNVVGENLKAPKLIEYKDYWEYLSVKEVIIREQPDIIISASAINDYIFSKIDGKISSSDDTLTLTLTKGEKVIKSFRELAPKALIVGFKLLVSPSKTEYYNAIDKALEGDYVDQVVYNDLTELKKGNQKRLVIGRFRSHYYEANDAGQLVDYIIKKSGR